MKKLMLIAATGALFSACNTGGGSKNVELKDFKDSASYAVGTSIGLNLNRDFESQGVDSSYNRDLMIAALSEALKNGETMLSEDDARDVVDRFFQKMSDELGEKNRAAGEKFLAENATKAGVVTTESGLQYIVLKEGEGKSPTLSDQVMVHYTGKLLNGEVFDSSVERNQPVTFYVRSVIPGWTEALQLMKPGADYKLFIPSDLAYGENGNPRGGIGPNEVLVFDVKLIQVITE